MRLARLDNLILLKIGTGRFRPLDDDAWLDEYLTENALYPMTHDGLTRIVNREDWIRAFDEEDFGQLDGGDKHIPFLRAFENLDMREDQ